MNNNVDKPNIIMIVMDSVRYDHLSCYGYHRNTTPNIDNIANEGVLFENCFSSAGSTILSHASLFTGTFRSRRGCNSVGNHYQTLAEVLSTYGYETVGYSNNGWVSHATSMSRGFRTFEEMFRFCSSRRNKYWKQNAKYLIVQIIHKILWTTQKKRYTGLRLTNKMVKSWLNQNKRNNVPFFMFIHYNDVHHPYRPPKPYDALFFENSLQLREVVKVNQDPHKYIAKQTEMTNEDFELLKSLYDGEIAYIDSGIGNLFEYLRDISILDNTLLIILADHGENLGEHQLMAHTHCLYDTLLHVPLIIRYPKLFSPGMKSSRLVQTVDIFPTILDILGIPKKDLDNQLQGYSIFSDKEYRSFAVAELPMRSLSKMAEKYPGFDWSIYERELKSIRTDNFKYIWASDEKDELYDVAADPWEQNNLIKSLPEKATKLREQLFSCLESSKTKESTEDFEFDESLKKHLKGLGYIV